MSTQMLTRQTQRGGNKKRLTASQRDAVALATHHEQISSSTSLPLLTSTMKHNNQPPRVFKNGEKDLWSPNILSCPNTGEKVFAGKGSNDLKAQVKSARGECHSNVFNTYKLMNTGGDTELVYGLTQSTMSQAEFERLGFQYGFQDNDVAKTWRDNNNKEAREAQVELQQKCQICYLAEVDKNENYSYEDAWISLTASSLKSYKDAIHNNHGPSNVFKDKVRASNITLPNITQGALMETGTSLDNHVLNTHTFETLEDAEEHQSSYDAETGVLKGPEGDAWLARVQTQPTASYDLMKEGSNEVVNVTSSRNALKHMKGGNDPGGAGAKTFNEWLKEHNLDMMKKKSGGNSSKNHFANPTKLPENGVVLKNKFGVNATYTIKGVISYD